MSVKADQLRKSGAKGKDLDVIVREQLQIIDDKLMRCERTWGRNVVAHDLPMNFYLPGLEKKDAQRIIYSTVIRSLADRGFELRILLDPKQTVLYIAWVTDLDPSEIEAMNRLLREHRIREEQVREFCSRTDSAAPAAASADQRGDDHTQ
jgi:hypothetical protein